MRVALAFNPEDSFSGRLARAAEAVAAFRAALDALPPRMPQLWDGDQA